MIFPKLEDVLNRAEVPFAVTVREVFGEVKFVWLMALNASTRSWNFNAL